MMDPHWCVDPVVPRLKVELKFNTGGCDCGRLGIHLGRGSEEDLLFHGRVSPGLPSSLPTEWTHLESIKSRRGINY